MGNHGPGGNNLPDVTTENDVPQVSIDIKALENLANEYDKAGRDLIVHIDYEFKHEQAMNFVVIDPVLFHTSSFIEVLDVATATAEEDFVTIDGFHEQAFDKILTPEANKAVSKDIAKKTLAPSQYAYQGLGVFSFPLRIGNKLRVTLLMRKPVPAFYERLHILTQETISETTKSTSKKKGL